MKHNLSPAVVPATLRNSKDWREGYNDALNNKPFKDILKDEWKLGWLHAKEDQILTSKDWLDAKA
jgi:hypothetical protein